MTLKGWTVLVGAVVVTLMLTACGAQEHAIQGRAMSCAEQNAFQVTGVTYQDEILPDGSPQRVAYNGAGQSHALTGPEEALGVMDNCSSQSAGFYDGNGRWIPDEYYYNPRTDPFNMPAPTSMVVFVAPLQPVVVVQGGVAVGPGGPIGVGPGVSPGGPVGVGPGGPGGVGPGPQNGSYEQPSMQHFEPGGGAAPNGYDPRSGVQQQQQGAQQPTIRQDEYGRLVDQSGRVVDQNGRPLAPRQAGNGQQNQVYRNAPGAYNQQGTAGGARAPAPPAQRR